jgi:hypothetical protein
MHLFIKSANAAEVIIIIDKLLLHRHNQNKAATINVPAG